MNAEIDISNVTLKTPRLTLRPWRESDLNDFFEYASVDGVGQMAGWLPHKDKDESRAILARFIEGKKTFALEKDGKVIGSLGIEKYREAVCPGFEDKKCRAIGYVLARPYWGQGLMPEAVNEVIRWLFEDVGLDVIFCGHFLKNHQSARVQEKCGFTHYAFSKFETRFGTVEDDEINILTREDWLAGSRNRLGEKIMSIEIRKLTPEDAKAYVHFFDTTPHDDHVPDHICYCVNWSGVDHRGLSEPNREQRRAMAAEYVKNGALQGYLALDNGKIIGWCNANDKENCAHCAGLLYAFPELQKATSAPGERVKAVYCFMVAEEYHRRGIARRLLRAVCEDAERDGYDYVEAYPQKDASIKWMQFMGFDALYKSEGFEHHGELDDKYVVRKYLK